jgi:predicted alpha/beta superfamily hydrolase
LVGAMSPSTWWDANVIVADVSATKGKSPMPMLVYVDSGDSGTDNDDVTQTTQLYSAYVSVGFVDGTTSKHVVQAGGQHSEIYWAQRLPGALGFLLGPGR